MNLSEKVADLPHKPGVYLMRDTTGLIIYIGKAKDLNKRVGSYFSKNELPPKVRSLIHFIRRLDFITTETEQEALILENKLIKKYQPRYNVFMRDDKTYPYLSLTLKEKFPRLILTRKKKRDGNMYFGPYPNVSQVRAIMTWMRKKFHMRPCNFEIDKKNSGLSNKYKSCLYLHIGACPAPCVEKISAKEYKGIVDEVILFLKGGHAQLINHWNKQMRAYSHAQRYEKAADLRDRINGLQRLYERISFQSIREEDLADRIESGNALSLLKKELGLPAIPIEIEAFDISNIQGKQPVGSLVTFSSGLPKKAGYRLFHVKTVKGPSDTAMMQEILHRRYSKLLRQNMSLPGLILVDGGKPQLHAAENVCEKLNISKKIIAALAKKEEELFVSGKKEPIKITLDNPSLLLLRRIRDEAHRFAVKFHKKLRSKDVFK